MPSNKPPKKIQSRTWGLIIPTEWENHMQIIYKAKEVAKYYYWIKHDKDFYGDLSTGEVQETKKEHIHLLFTFSNSRDLSTVQNYFAEFNLTEKEETEALLLKANSPEKELSGKYSQKFLTNSYESIKNAYGSKRYLVHKDNPEKFQYNPLEVETNDKLFANCFIEKVSSDEELEIIYKAYEKPAGDVTFREFCERFNTLFATMNAHSKMTNVHYLRCEWRYQQGEAKEKRKSKSRVNHIPTDDDVINAAFPCN
jgi:hypothetical protein